MTQTPEEFGETRETTGFLHVFTMEKRSLQPSILGAAKELDRIGLFRSNLEWPTKVSFGGSEIFQFPFGRWPFRSHGWSGWVLRTRVSLNGVNMRGRASKGIYSWWFQVSRNYITRPCPIIYSITSLHLIKSPHSLFMFDGSLTIIHHYTQSYFIFAGLSSYHFSSYPIQIPFKSHSNPIQIPFKSHSNPIQIPLNPHQIPLNPHKILMISHSNPH